MTVPTQATAIVGREDELRRLAQWTEHLATGPTAVLIRGEAGIGKTTMWASVVETARNQGARVLMARPVEAELPLGYAALGDLLGAAADAILDELPEPQATALAAALSTGVGGSGEPLLVGRASLAALRRLAASAPPPRRHRRHPMA